MESRTRWPVSLALEPDRRTDSGHQRPDHAARTSLTMVRRRLACQGGQGMSRAEVARPLVYISYPEHTLSVSLKQHHVFSARALFDANDLGTAIVRQTFGAWTGSMSESRCPRAKLRAIRFKEGKLR